MSGRRENCSSECGAGAGIFAGKWFWDVRGLVRVLNLGGIFLEVTTTRVCFSFCNLTRTSGVWTFYPIFKFFF